MELHMRQVAQVFLLIGLLGAFSACVGPAASESPTASYSGPAPTLYWSFDNETISGSTVSDATGTTGQDGTISATGVTTGSTGISGEAIELDGSSGIVTGDLPNTNTFTVSVWLETNSFPTGDSFIAVNLDNGPGAWEGWLIGARNDETLSFTVEGGGGAAEEIIVRTSSEVPLGQWTHLVGVMNEATQEIELYRDGELQEVVSLPYSEINYGSVGLVIGRHSYFNNRYFKGKVDELAIFNDAILTPAQIDELYQVGKAGQPIPVN
jgi:hypothetical protein